MKNYFKLLVKFTVFTVLLVSWGCEDKSPINHNPIEPKDTIKDFWINHDSCLAKKPGMWFVPIDFVSFNSDRSKVFISKGMSMGGFVMIDRVSNIEITMANKFWDSKRSTWRILPSNTNFNSCPYNKDKFFSPMYSGDPTNSNEEVKEYAYWAIFDPVSGSVEEVEITIDNKLFPVRNLPQGQGAVGIISWLPNSTPGNDYFFLNDNSILHLQKGTKTVGIPNLTLPPGYMISSLSPNGKFAFYQIGTESYINNTKVNLEIREYDGIIHWSNDSKSFVFVAYGENGHNFVYRYSVLDDGNVKLINRINLSNNFCSFFSSLSACFLSDSTLGVCVFKYDNPYGNLYEINFDGTLKRVLTDYTN